jgi:hypothetical protein
VNVEVATTEPYRIRMRTYRLVQGERQYLDDGWIKGFDTAMAAALYWEKGKRIANVEIRATRPADGGRAWVTLQGLRAIARKEAR